MTDEFEITVPKHSGSFIDFEGVYTLPGGLVEMEDDEEEVME